MLTGQASIDFDYSHNISNFNDYNGMLKMATIISWFDNACIHITIGYERELNRWNYCIYDRFTGVTTSNSVYKTRMFAQEASIEKANKIYNEQY